MTAEAPAWEPPPRDMSLLPTIRQFVLALHHGDPAPVWNTLEPGYGTHCYDCRAQGDRRRYGSLDLCENCVSQRCRVKAA